MAGEVPVSGVDVQTESLIVEGEGEPSPVSEEGSTEDGSASEEIPPPLSETTVQTVSCTLFPGAEIETVQTGSEIVQTPSAVIDPPCLQTVSEIVAPCAVQTDSEGASE